MPRVESRKAFWVHSTTQQKTYNILRKPPSSAQPLRENTALPFDPVPYKGTLFKLCLKAHY
eukprot:3540449-Amphidinium_carterae.1